MSSTWIKILSSLPDNPDIERMVNYLDRLGDDRGSIPICLGSETGAWMEERQIQRNCVIGGLCRVWIWANKYAKPGTDDLFSYPDGYHKIDGRLEQLDSVAGINGFGGAMLEVRWVDHVDDEQRDIEFIVFSDFDRHNVTECDRAGKSTSAERMRRKRKKDKEPTGQSEDSPSPSPAPVPRPPSPRPRLEDRPGTPGTVCAPLASHCMLCHVPRNCVSGGIPLGCQGERNSRSRIRTRKRATAQASPTRRLSSLASRSAARLRRRACRGSTIPLSGGRIGRSGTCRYSRRSRIATMSSFGFSRGSSRPRRSTPTALPRVGSSSEWFRNG